MCCFWVAEIHTFIVQFRHLQHRCASSPNCPTEEQLIMHVYIKPSPIKTSYNQMCSGGPPHNHTRTVSVVWKRFTWHPFLTQSKLDQVILGNVCHSAWIHPCASVSTGVTFRPASSFLALDNMHYLCTNCRKPRTSIKPGVLEGIAQLSLAFFFMFSVQCIKFIANFLFYCLQMTRPLYILYIGQSLYWLKKILIMQKSYA